MSCSLEIKTLKGDFVLLEHTSVDLTVGELYEKISEFEATQDGKWKCMLIVRSSPKTLKPIADAEKKISEYGVIAGVKYRVEVILHMGACHSTCKRN